jgi:hypothetical protein
MPNPPNHKAERRKTSFQPSDRREKVFTPNYQFPHASLQKIILAENKKYGDDIFNIIVGNKKYIVENNLLERSVETFSVEQEKSSIDLG